MDKIKATLFDSKNITAAGGIVVAIALSYVLLKVMTNDFAHLEARWLEHDKGQTQIQIETNKVLRDVATAIEGNTKVIEQLLRQQRP